ncbi:MAG TPA: HNH endonuclease [Ignavibacteriales bacterium]|nr:HNH endonuclease [Ignavibacteriales bacterium]
MSTTTKKTYIEKLKYPRWQKKRLEILARDKWTCQICGNAEESLNVHHRVYSDNEPWDEQDGNLITLCESCHEHETKHMKNELDVLCRTLRIKFFSGDIARIAEGFAKLKFPYLPEVAASTLNHLLSNEDEMGRLVTLYFKFLENKYKSLREGTDNQSDGNK